MRSCNCAIRAWASTVTMVQLPAVWPFGSFQCSHSPAMPNGPRRACECSTAACTRRLPSIHRKRRQEPGSAAGDMRCGRWACRQAFRRARYELHPDARLLGPRGDQPPLQKRQLPALPGFAHYRDRLAGSDVVVRRKLGRPQQVEALGDHGGRGSQGVAAARGCSLGERTGLVKGCSRPGGLSREVGRKRLFVGRSRHKRLIGAVRYTCITGRCASALIYHNQGPVKCFTEAIHEELEWGLFPDC